VSVHADRLATGGRGERERGAGDDRDHAGDRGGALCLGYGRSVDSTTVQLQWLCGDDGEAKQAVAGLIRDAGYVSVDLGGTADCTVMEAPRRPGAVYGEEYREAEAAPVVEAVREGQPVPPPPSY